MNVHLVAMELESIGKKPSGPSGNAATRRRLYGGSEYRVTPMDFQHDFCLKRSLWKVGLGLFNVVRCKQAIIDWGADTDPGCLRPVVFAMRSPTAMTEQGRAAYGKEG